MVRNSLYEFLAKLVLSIPYIGRNFNIELPSELDTFELMRPSPVELIHSPIACLILIVGPIPFASFPPSYNALLLTH